MPEVEEVPEEKVAVETPEAAAAPAPDAATAAAIAAAIAEAQKVGRAEKKARKAVAKLGLKQLKDAERVVFKKSASQFIVIDQADVFFAGRDGMIAFGAARVDDKANIPFQNAAKQFEGMNAANFGAFGGEEGEGDEDLPELADAAGEKAGDAAGADDVDGISATDIDLVMSQTSVSREEAVAALKKNRGDIVNSIMELTI
jgi:nascent polypeptide-associated complex subunit alpha